MRRRYILLLSVFLNLILLSKVNAQTFYSDLSEVVLDSTKYQVEVIKKYRFYKDDKVGEYVLRGSAYKYPYVDNDDIRYGEYGSVKDVCDKDKDVKDVTMYPYQKLKGIEYVLVYNNSRSINIEDIHIYSKDNELKYEVVNTSNYKDNILGVNGSIYLKIESVIEYMDFNIVINSKDFSRIIMYKTYTSSYEELTDITTIVNQEENKLPINNLSSKYYTDIMYSNVYTKDDGVIWHNPVTKCMDRDIYVYNYKVDRKYLEGYYTDYEGYIKDVDDYKVYYRYVLDTDYIDNIDSKLDMLNKEITNNNLSSKIEDIKKRIADIDKSSNKEDVNSKIDDIYVELNGLKEGSASLLDVIEDYDLINLKIDKLYSYLDNVISINKIDDNMTSSEGSFVNMLKIKGISIYITMFILVIILFIYLICRKKAYK